MLGAFALSRVFAKADTHAFTVEVVVGDNEPTDSALRRFRKGVLNSGILPEVKRRRYFEDTQDIKKRKLSERFKKVFRPNTAGAGDASVALGKPKSGSKLTMGQPSAAPAMPKPDAAK